MKRTLVLLLALVAALPAHAAKAKYTYVRVGSPDVTTSTTGGTMLMGGSTDVDAGFAWMCNHSGGGDFLVIRATGTDAYNPWIKDEVCKDQVNSVATLIIPSTAAANDDFVANTIASAEAIFIAGGDQSDYIKYWTGTKAQNALNGAIARRVPVGGTSAGAMVLTQYVYSAMLSKGVDSAQALANPYNKYLTLASDFAKVVHLGDKISDTHFAARDRMGRDLAFLCRLTVDYGVAKPRSIAVDEQTALLIKESGAASVVGNGNVYFLEAPTPATACTSGQPLSIAGVTVHRVPTGGSFDVANWTGGSGGTDYTLTVTDGVVTSDQAGGGLIY